MSDADEAGPVNEQTAQSETAAESQSAQRTITIKSIFFGIAALLFTIAVTDYSDFHLKQSPFVSNHLPPGPIFLILSLALIWNPIWRSRVLMGLAGVSLTLIAGAYNYHVAQAGFLFGAHWLILIPVIAAVCAPVWRVLSPRMLMSSREMLFALILVFAGCWTAGAGLNRFYTYMQVVPGTYYDNAIASHKYQTLEYVPEDIWPGGKSLQSLSQEPKEKQRIYDAFYTGYEEQQTDGIPWDAWMPPLLTKWFPLLALFSICLIALALIVHRQWAHHEQLAYPLANICTDFFTSTNKQRWLPDLFYNRLFWIATGLVVIFHGIRLLHAWFPNNAPDISNSANFSFIWGLFPTLGKSGAFWTNQFAFFFLIIGICYFLSREIGLTLGLSQILLAVASAQLYLSTGNKITNDDTGNMRAGAYIAYAAVILYTGRHYYKSLLIKALTFRQAEEHEIDGIYAARILMFAFTGLLIVLCTTFNLDLPSALLFSILGLLLFLVFSRIICETGIPYLQVGWSPGLLISKLFGVTSIGAAPLVMMYFIGGLLFPDPKEAMLPYVSNSFKMADNYKMKLRRICTIIMIVASAAIVISVSARIYQHYTIGSNQIQDSYGNLHVPRTFVQSATRDLTALEDLGMRSDPEADGYIVSNEAGEERHVSFFERLSLINPDVKTIIYVLVGGAGVVMFFLLRIRYTGFVLHPVLFLVWNTYPIQKTFYAFLLGWFTRELIVRFGGGRVYQDCKPFFIGLIFGELFMGVTGIGIGLVYHVFSGELPPPFRVFVS